MTTSPAAVTYVSFVSCETVCIALTLASLNDLEVKCGDVLNSYITSPVKYKIWTYLGPDHGEDEDKKAIIVRALYGLKSSGANFRAHLCECMAALEYKPCLSDPDIWLTAQHRGGIDSYSYIFCYVDDIMVIHHYSRPILDRIDKFMYLK